MFSQRSIRHSLFALNSKLDIYTDTAVKNGFFLRKYLWFGYISAELFSRPLISMYMRQEMINEKHVCGSVSSQRSSLANLNMQMSLRITTKPVQPLLTPCTWKKRVVFRRFSAFDRILSLTGNLEALSTNFCLFSIIFFRGKIFTVVGI